MDIHSSGKTGREERGVSLYSNGQMESTELHLEMDEKLTQSIWVRIKVKAREGDIIVGVCYRQPEQED